MGLLEASIDEKTKKIETSAGKNKEGFIEWLHLQLRPTEYMKLKERKTIGSHEGYRHIEVWDASNLENLDFGEKMLYLKLQGYESKYAP